MKLLKQQSDGEIDASKKRKMPRNLMKVFKKTKHIITGYKRKEQTWKREKTDLKSKIMELERKI